MISWLLAGNERRFLPIVASPLVALIVVGRALTSAGSGAVAPVSLLIVVAFTTYLDRRRARRRASVAFASQTAPAKLRIPRVPVLEAASAT
jgi:hypothetical protein